MRLEEELVPLRQMLLGQGGLRGQRQVVYAVYRHITVTVLVGNSGDQHTTVIVSHACEGDGGGQIQAGFGVIETQLVLACKHVVYHCGGGPGGEGGG